MSEEKTKLSDLHILLGVSGGIAAYKAVDLASKLTAGGAKVNTVMTENACRLVGPKSFEAVTCSAVFTSLWERSDARYSMPDARPVRGPAGNLSNGARRGAESRIENRESRILPHHINLADWADIVVVAPATANIIGKIANGICDDLLSTVLCACWALIKSGAALLAPAMNNNMWDNPAVQRNVAAVKKMGFRLIGPQIGRLASGIEAIGRMSEPKDILEAIRKLATKAQRHKEIKSKKQL